MSDEPLSKSEIILYQTEDGRTRIQCRFENETLWLTQAQIAELFQTTPQNVTLHLKAIFAEGELVEAATCKDYLQVRTEGKGYVARAQIANGRNLIDSWKLFVGFAAPGTGNKDTYPHKVISTPFLGAPGYISTETYLAIGPFTSEQAADNALSYLSC